jgi:hypothetical protein
MHLGLRGWRPIAIAAATVAVLAGTAAPAAATTNVASNCKLRGPVAGLYTNVCVRLQQNVAEVRAYGALDADSTSIRVYVRALHLDECNASGCRNVYAAAAKGAWGYVNQATSWYGARCGYYYRVVMSYDIRWTTGLLTQATGFSVAAYPSLLCPGAAG